MSDEKVTASTEQVTEAKFDGAVADGSTLGAVEVLGGQNHLLLQARLSLWTLRMLKVRT